MGSPFQNPPPQIPEDLFRELTDLEGGRAEPISQNYPEAIAAFLENFAVELDKGLKMSLGEAKAEPNPLTSSSSSSSSSASSSRGRRSGSLGGRGVRRFWGGDTQR